LKLAVLLFRNKAESSNPFWLVDSFSSNFQENKKQKNIKLKKKIQIYYLTFKSRVAHVMYGGVAGRDLTTYPLPLGVKTKLIKAGFRSSDDFVGLTPIELSKG